MSEQPDFINWRRMGSKITTSGQPTEAQLGELRDMGVTHVVNLGPHSNKGALDDEAGSLAALGLTYVYIPVDFEAPTDADFELFCAALDDLKDQVIHVHCIYNARVSAFFYRYAKVGLGGDVNSTFANMDSIWRPGNNWASFVGIKDAIGKPNLYSGDDY